MLVDAEAGTTRDPVDELIELGGKTWRFVDTAGIRRRFRESQGADYYAALRTAGALEVAEVAVVLVDASQPLTEQDLRIISMVIEAGRALVIAFNKWDMVDEERQHYLGREIDRQLYNARWAPRVNISATTGRHVDRLVPAIETALAGWETRVPTGRLNSWLTGLIAATPPPVRGGRQPKVLFATQAGIRPAARRAVHHGVPGGRLPPVRGAEAARGVRLRGQPAEGIDAAAGKARPRLTSGAAAPAAVSWRATPEPPAALRPAGGTPPAHRPARRWPAPARLGRSRARLAVAWPDADHSAP